MKGWWTYGLDFNKLSLMKIENCALLCVQIDNECYMVWSIILGIYWSELEIICAG